MKKVYETPNVVITTFDSVDATSVTVARSIGGPISTNSRKSTKTQTTQLP